jgi:outer membrane protein assembly factor BamD (BamD/ComL family)
MKKAVIGCLLFLMTGCVALTQSGHKQSTPQTELYQSALTQLFEHTDSGPLETYIQKYPDSLFSENARRILNLHKSNISYKNKLKTCNQQVEASKVEVKKLAADIERLTQLHLKMGRTSP